MATKDNVVVGITAGLAAAILAPMLIPALKQGARPLAKSMVKGGLLLYEKGREAIAEAGEKMEDLIAETQAEMMSGAAAMQAAGPGHADEASVSDLASKAGDDNGKERSSVVRLNPSSGADQDKS